MGRVGLTSGFALGTAGYEGLAWLGLLLPAPMAVAVSVLTLGSLCDFHVYPAPVKEPIPGPAPKGRPIIGEGRGLTRNGLDRLLIADQFRAAAGGAVGAYPIYHPHAVFSM